MKNSHSQTRRSRGMIIEDRLLKEGEKYKEKQQKIRKNKNKRMKNRFLSEKSKQMLEKKNHDSKAEISKSPTTEFETPWLASVIGSLNHINTPSHLEKWVVSDFLSIPTSPPIQFKPSSSEIEDELLESYKEEINRMTLGNTRMFNGYKDQRRESKSRNKEIMEELVHRSGNKDFNATESKHQRTMGSSVSNLGRVVIGKYGKKQWSDDQIEEEYSDNLFNEINTIEKVINGDYEDDENVNYYSIGSKSFGIQDSCQKDGFTTPEISDPLIDPFMQKSEEDLLYHQEYDLLNNFQNKPKNKGKIMFQNYKYL